MKDKTTRTRIVIVDDHPMIREALMIRIASQSDLVVCGEAAEEDEGFELVKKILPDLVLVDISLKSGNGIELLKRVRQLSSSIKSLVISTFSESLYAERALRAGALGYLNKQESNDRLMPAIRAVLCGDRYFSSEMRHRLVSKALGKNLGIADPLEALTDRELEIFKLIGAGVTTQAIAEQLYLSTHTVDTHRENIKRKLGAKNGAELNRQAIHSMLESG